MLTRFTGPRKNVTRSRNCGASLGFRIDEFGEIRIGQEIDQLRSHILEMIECDRRIRRILEDHLARTRLTQLSRGVDLCKVSPNEVPVDDRAIFPFTRTVFNSESLRFVGRRRGVRADGITVHDRT
jgi:hypothetical protein